MDAGDIASIALTVHRGWDDVRNTISLRLAYAVEVRRGSLPWSFIVDADTGVLIVVQQEFST